MERDGLRNGDMGIYVGTGFYAGVGVGIRGIQKELEGRGGE